MKTQVLVVDDNLAIRETIEDILTWEGYSVATAANGLEALDQVKRDRPAVVLLDLEMPVLDGWGFVAALRRGHIDVPIVAVTGANDVNEWAREIKADASLGKPFELEDLLGTVARFVAPSRASAQSSPH